MFQELCLLCFFRKLISFQPPCFLYIFLNKNTDEQLTNSGEFCTIIPSADLINLYLKIINHKDNENETIPKARKNKFLELVHRERFWILSMFYVKMV